MLFLTELYRYCLNNELTPRWHSYCHVYLILFTCSGIVSVKK